MIDRVRAVSWSAAVRHLAGLVLLTSLGVSVVVGTARAAAWTHPTTGDYIVRVVRAMGEEAHVRAGAPPSAYLRHLVQRGYLSPAVEPTIPLGAPLSRDVALRISATLVHAGSPAPAFLSETYLASTLAAVHATALGFVRSDDETLGMWSLLGGKVEEPKKKCPTPRKRLQRKCPKPK